MRNVLFVCTHNAGRSQMAEAFFNELAPDDLRAESGGSQPATAVWPTVVEAMAEVGLDLSRRRPRRLTVEMQLHADWAITMACGDVCPYVPTIVENWDVADPAHRDLEEVRRIRDDIRARVEHMLVSRADDIRRDRTSHHARLVRLLPTLDEEFADRHSREEIRACADAILARYDDASIRMHIVTVALRQARECLRAEHCNALTPAV